MPDVRIDYSHATFLADSQLVKVVELREVKRQTTLRLDTSVLDYLRCTRHRYQSCINAVLSS